MKKKLAIMYNIRAPVVIEIRETVNPSHLPKNIPDIINKGDPKPKRTIQNIEKKKNKLNLYKGCHL